jgi:hypothetical protein
MSEMRRTIEADGSESGLIGIPSDSPALRRIASVRRAVIWQRIGTAAVAVGVVALIVALISN